MRGRRGNIGFEGAPIHHTSRLKDFLVKVEILFPGQTCQSQWHNKISAIGAVRTGQAPEDGSHVLSERDKILALFEY